MQLPFSVATYRQRINSVRATMAERGLDGLVTTLPDGIHWLCGFDTIGYLWPQALIIDRTDAEPVLVTRTSEGPGAAATTWLSEVRLYDIARERPADALRAALLGRGLAEGRVGVDLQSFTLVPTVWSALSGGLPDVTFEDASDVVPAARLIKEPAELAYQRQAAEIADYAITRVMDSIRPGVSEAHLAGIASLALGEAGSEYAAIPPMVVSGERTALVHALASRRSLALGDLICVELAGVVARYHAVVMRTFSLGRPSPRVRQVASCLSEAMAAAIAAVRPGDPVARPDQECNSVLSSLGLVGRRCHRIGYSLGVAYPPGWLEPMTLVDGDEHLFEPRMSFTIEPNLSLPDEGFGLKLGETVVCTPDGGERLSHLDPRLMELDW
jgi:Xaa-Pro aminopeptidase